jgi:hypothetical protein
MNKPTSSIPAPTGNGAPNRILDLERAPSERASGSPAASSAAAHVSARSRVDVGAVSASRATTSRQRWRGSTSGGGAIDGPDGPDTSASLPDDGRA